MVDVFENIKNGGNVLDGGDSLTIIETGTISTNGTDAVSGTNGNRVVNNSFLSAFGVKTEGINLSGGTNTVVNNGGIPRSGDSGSANTVVGTRYDGRWVQARQ